jgi:hypothetical protein
MLTYLPTYRILICREHHYAIYSVDEHLKRYHKLPIVDRRAVINAYSNLSLLSPDQVPLPTPYIPPLVELGAPEDALLCCCSIACSFITTSRSCMKKHINQQHSIYLTRWSTPSAISYAEHAAQLWRPVKAQTFFRERRYIRYCVVQEPQEPQEPQPQDRSQPRTVEQREAERHQQRLASLSYEWDIVASRDSQAIERVAEEAPARDYTS